MDDYGFQGFLAWFGKNTDAHFLRLMGQLFATPISLYPPQQDPPVMILKALNLRYYNYVFIKLCSTLRVVQ